MNTDRQHTDTDFSGEILDLIEATNYEQALKQIERREASVRTPRDRAEAENCRGVIAVLQRRYEKAQASFDRAIGFDPFYKTAKENHARLLDDFARERELRKSYPPCLALLITYNRIAYTRFCLNALLEVDYPHLEIVIWDNASSDGTQQYLKVATRGFSNVRLHLSETNDGVVRPMNQVWSENRSAEILAKLDNDTRVPQDWLRRLVDCHRASEEFGVLSGFHFRKEGEKMARKSEIVSFEDCKVLKQMYVGGCAVTIRRELFEQFPPIQESRPSLKGPFLESGWTQFQQRLGEAGYCNGYPWPPVHVDHMEDTRSSFCITTDEHQNYKREMRGMTLEQFTEQLCVWKPH